MYLPGSIEIISPKRAGTVSTTLCAQHLLRSKCRVLIPYTRLGWAWATSS